MRAAPLVRVLDEPTAALDAETEHSLFERYACVANQNGHANDGCITVLVSHRFSTVCMADVNVVLEGSGAVEVGTREELMSTEGPYAGPYSIQASAYR